MGVTAVGLTGICWVPTKVPTIGPPTCSWLPGVRGGISSNRSVGTAPGLRNGRCSPTCSTWLRMPLPVWPPAGGQQSKPVMMCCQGHDDVDRV